MIHTRSAGMVRLVLVLLVTGGLLVAIAVGAHAETEARITQVRSVDGEVVAVLTAEGLPAGESIDPGSVTVTVNGEPVRATAEPILGAETLNQRVVLTIDTSNSMRGEPLAAAQDAARSFVSAVPESTEIGLVTYAGSARELVAPTTDRETLFRSIDSLTTEKQTVVYDGLALALDVVGEAPLGTVVLLTDGKDTGSTLSYDQVLSMAEQSGTTVDTMGLGRVAGVEPELRTLASSTGGRYYAADDAAGLVTSFTEAGESIANQVIVTAAFPPGMDGQGATITVSAESGGDPIAADAFVTLSSGQVTSGSGTGQQSYGPVPVAVSGSQLSTGALIAGLVVMGLGLFVILGVAALRVTRAQDDDRKLLGRLQLYSLTGKKPVQEQETTAFGNSQAAMQAVQMARKVAHNRDLEATLEQRLDAAAVPLRPAEWLLIHAGAAIGGGLLFLLLSSGSFVVSLFGVALGLLIPWTVLASKERRRHNRFFEQLPDTLQLMASSLAAGYSLPQAMDTVAKEADSTVAAEFNRALVETRLGVPPEEALEGIANRMQSRDFLWVVMAINIQRQVGGNLAELLVTVADVLREREYLRRQVHVLSAEGRLSAWIIGSLPVGFALFLLIFRPELIAVLWTDPRGLVLLVIWAVLMLVGVIWLRRTVRIEV